MYILAFVQSASEKQNEVEEGLVLLSESPAWQVIHHYEVTVKIRLASELESAKGKGSCHCIAQDSATKEELLASVKRPDLRNAVARLF